MVPRQAASETGSNPSFNLPWMFRRPIATRRLGVVAASLSLASSAGLFLGFVPALTTLCVGALYFRFVRSPKTVRHPLRWLASLPFAMVNAAATGGFFFLADPQSGSDALVSFALGALAGVTLGAAVWIPALVATLLLFGIPLAWSQRLASRGLAGEEKGERIAAIASALVGAVTLFGLLAGRPLASRYDPNVPLAHPLQAGVVVGLALLAVATGLLAAVVATRRGALRRAFVRRAEAGAVSGYRVDASPHGRVLLRISEQPGRVYRVAQLEEVLLELDDDDEVLAESARR